MAQTANAQPDKSHWLVSAEQTEHADMMEFARDLAMVQRRILAPGSLPATEAGRPWFPRQLHPSVPHIVDRYEEYATPERQLSMQQFVVWYLGSYTWIKGYHHGHAVLQTVAQEELGRQLYVDEDVLFSSVFHRVWHTRQSQIVAEQQAQDARVLSENGVLS